MLNRRDLEIEERQERHLFFDWVMAPVFWQLDMRDRVVFLGQEYPENEQLWLISCGTKSDSLLEIP